MTQVITIDYHYNDDEEPEYMDKPIKIGQRLVNDEWQLWDNTNSVQIAWDKTVGIVPSIDKYILENINIDEIL